MLAEPLTGIHLDAPPITDEPVAEIPQKTGPTRAQIEQLESHLLELPQVDIAVTHRFAPGLYMREIRVPADTLMTGRVHKAEHVSVMVSGCMTTLVDGEMRRIEGYHPFIAPPGTKRVGYTHTEMVWLTVHHNPENLRDIAAIEAMLCEPLQAVQALEDAQ